MAEALSVVLIILAIVLTTLVLTQSKGADLGGFLGGGSGDQGVTRTRRGVEAVMHNMTKLVAAIFFVVAFITLFVWGGRF